MERELCEKAGVLRLPLQSESPLTRHWGGDRVGRKADKSQPALPPARLPLVHILKWVWVLELS